MEMQDQRQQVLALKQQLTDSLGEMAKEYWESLTSFITEKTSKEELDTNLLYLTPHQQKLHNRLLVMMIANSVSTQVRQSTDDIYVVKSRNDNAKHFQKRFNTKIIQSLSSEERDRISALENNIPEEEDPPEPKGIEGVPKTCLEERDLPSADALRTRLKFVSAFHELDGNISPQVVQMMNDALENYLKGILTNALQKSKVHGKKLDVEQLLFATNITNMKVDSDLLEYISL